MHYRIYTYQGKFLGTLIIIGSELVIKGYDKTGEGLLIKEINEIEKSGVYQRDSQIKEEKIIELVTLKTVKDDIYWQLVIKGLISRMYLVKKEEN